MVAGSRNRACVMVCAWLATSHAQDADPPAEDTPWSAGVTESQKAEAERLLSEGNELFVQSSYREALDVYEQAVASWDHPAIRFNIVRTLINLDKPLEAFENLQLALKYGDRPLDPDVYREALGYQKLLRAQIASLTVTCRQTGAVVSVDGAEFVKCPGTRTERVTPGNHAVVGKLRDHLTSTQDIVVLGGKSRTVAVSLVSIAEATVTERYWAAWKPWAVVAGGAVLGGSGLLLYRKAESDMDSYIDEFGIACPTGCTPEQVPRSLDNLRSRALLENKLAIATMITGGAVAIGGLALVILNRPRAVIPETPRIAPAISPGQVGIELTVPF